MCANVDVVFFDEMFIFIFFLYCLQFQHFITIRGTAVTFSDMSLQEGWLFWFHCLIYFTREGETRGWGRTYSL